MYLFGGFTSDSGTSDEIWSLSAKEILRKGVVNNKEAGKIGEKFTIC